MVPRTFSHPAGALAASAGKALPNAITKVSVAAADPARSPRPQLLPHDPSCSLESLEGLFEVGDHIPGVLDAHREAHEVLPDSEPLPPRRRELAVRGGGGMDGEGIDVS